MDWERPDRTIYLRLGKMEKNPRFGLTVKVYEIILGWSIGRFLIE